MTSWPSFSAMRSDIGRTWHRRSDLLAAIEAAGLVMTWHDARKALRSLPRPERRYGHFRYTDQHREAVLAYGRSMTQGGQNA